MFNLRPHADRKRNTRSGLLFAIFLASTALTATAGYAQTATWIDNSAQTWDTPSGWDTNAEPDANTDVIIPPADQTNGGVGIVLNTPDAVARSVQINGGLNIWDGILVVGSDLTATGGSALLNVHGPNSTARLTVNGQLNFDVGGSMWLYEGGILKTHGALLSGNGDIGNTYSMAAIISDNALFDNSGHTLTLGRAGRAYIYVYGGGELRTATLDLGVEAAATGILAGDGLLQIGNGGTVNVTNTLEVGNRGQGEVNITAGGLLNTQVARLGDQAGGNGLAIVDGGIWNSGGALNVGVRGTGTLSVLNAGVVNMNSLSLGNYATGTGAVTVSGAGSSLESAESAYIGERGAGELSILDGATVNIGTNAANELLVGYYAGAQGTVLVEGGSSLTGTGALHVGSGGEALLIVEGANSTASFHDLSSGGSAGASGRIVLSNRGELAITDFATIGYAGTASLTLSGDSRFTAANLGIATADAGSTGHVTVNDSVIDIAGQIDLGVFGTASMLLENGAKVESTTFQVAGDPTGNGRLTMTGTGTSLENTGDAVFGVGGNSELRVIDNALAHIGGNLAFGNAASSGRSDLAIANGRVLVDGNLTQYANSTYAYTIGDGPSVGGGIAVTGAATILDGAQLAVRFDGAVSMGDQFVVLDADGGVTGTYTLLNGGQLSAFFGIDALYDPNTVSIVVTSSRDFADVAATPNQVATAEGLQSLGSGNQLYGTILNIATEDEARLAFDQLSGEIHASFKTALIDDSRFVRNAVNDRIRAAFGDATVAAMPVLAYGPGGPERTAPDADLLTVWGQGFGSWGDWSSDGNAASVSRNTGGFLTGADAFVSDWRVGLMAGYSHTGVSADDRASSGSADSYHLGLYGGTEWGALAFRSGLAYSWHAMDTRRNVAFPGFAEAISGSYDAGTLQGFGELAYRFDAAPQTVLEPFANLAFISHRTDGYAETGGTAALSAATQNTNTTFTTLGLRASHGFTMGMVDVTARGMLGWRHAFGDTTPTSTHAFAGGDAFTVAGAPISRDTALVEAGLDFRLTPAATLGFTYSGQLASGTHDQAIKANLDVKF